MAKAKFFTRCAPDRFSATVSQLIDEQRVAVCEMCFGSLIQLNCGRLKRKLCWWLVEKINTARCILELNGTEVELSPKSFSYIMGVSDGGKPLQLEGERSTTADYLHKFNATSRGINIKALAEILRNSKLADDFFKVTFMMFALCTVLCPPEDVHISGDFLFSLIDVKSIRTRNWATFCFHRLIQGITRYKEDKLAYVGGCILYLEVMYNDVNNSRWGSQTNFKTLHNIVLYMNRLNI